ncbi:MAG: PEP/pyruvate-binding domain-containing protein [Anaerolineae bacterium]
MTKQYTLSLADAEAVLQTVGGKGAALSELTRAGLPVPDGFHITVDAYRDFVEANDLQPAIVAALEAADPNEPASLETASRTIEELFLQGRTPPQVAAAIAKAYAALSGAEPVAAVRSSATAEDLPEASFAGQQETFLNIKGIDEVLEAVKRCWASLWTARAIGYRAHREMNVEGLGLAIVVQKLVPAESAGILFTANPMTGRRNEVVINAAWGLGEAVVGGEVTPDTYVVDKETSQVLEREVAEKSVMTVRVNGGTETRPVPEELREAPVLDDAQAAELARLSVRIEELYGDPRDIEWVLADGEFAIVQARPITALPQPMAEPPEEWPMPDPDGKYMRGSIIDFMPDPLSPLFESMALPAISEGMRLMLDEMIGGQLPGFFESYLVTINDYAYMSADFKAPDLWWILVRMAPAIPRLMKNAANHWEEVAHPRYREAVAEWEDRAPRKMKPRELVGGASALTHAMGHYLSTLQIDTLGIAAGTEMLFTAVYDKLIRKEDDPPAPTYLLGADSLPIQAEKALYDLAGWCREHDDLAQYLLRTPPAKLGDQWDSSGAPPDVSPETWEAWRDRFQNHLNRYGYSVYDLDFAEPIPAHDPTPLLQTLRVFIRDPERDPHARQQRLLEQRKDAIEAIRERIGGLKRKLFDKTLGWAQTYTALREDSIFEIGLAYPQLREMLLELGLRFVKAGAIAEPDDIFWLERTEFERGAEALEQGEALEDLSERVEERKMEWRAEKRVAPPAQLPQKGRVLGINPDAFLPATAEEQTGNILTGVGCSPGQVSGTARVLHGPEDFDHMRAGDILVADITTPAWTPLFALASGIVTNVGGPLSHGSIVAREYSIPAVLGTGVATKRIRSGQEIAVDGDAGTVELL